MSGTRDIVLAGGVESMTRVPLSSAIKLAVDNGYDHPDSPRVRARYAGAELNQFAGAETIAARYEISRAMLDRFGFASHRRPVQATASVAFEQELLPIVGLHAAVRPAMHVAAAGVRSAAHLAALTALK